MIHFTAERERSVHELYVDSDVSVYVERFCCFFSLLIILLFSASLFSSLFLCPTVSLICCFVLLYFPGGGVDASADGGDHDADGCPRVGRFPHRTTEAHHDTARAGARGAAGVLAAARQGG